MAEKIIVVGCGGTGSHYIKELGRLLYGMGEKRRNMT
jgi:tRNA A37 threonylcarbamoyladenosine dehydratase